MSGRRHHTGFPVRLAAYLAVIATWGVLALVMADAIYKAVGP